MPPAPTPRADALTLNKAAASDDDSARVTAAARQDEWLAVTVGLLYVGTLFWREYILHYALGVPQALAPEYLRFRASYHALAMMAIRLPAGALLAWAVLRPRGRQLRRALWPADIREITKLIGLTCAVSFVLNALNLWPFTWRWAGDPSAQYLRELMENRNWPAIAIWAGLIAVITPIIEEVVFRFGILRVLASYTRSPWAGILGSSVLFGIAHLGYWPIWQADRPHLVNASWLVAFSVLLGWLTVRRQGNITSAIAIHSTRNAVELGLLLAALSSSPG